MSVALSGDTALIGSDANASSSPFSLGSAYVFTRSGVNWTQQQQLTASDAAEGDQFGISVALSGDTALIGANLDDDGATDSGSAYENRWGQTRLILTNLVCALICLSNEK